MSLVHDLEDPVYPLSYQLFHLVLEARNMRGRWKGPAIWLFPVGPADHDIPVGPADYDTEIFPILGPLM